LAAAASVLFDGSGSPDTCQLLSSGYPTLRIIQTPKTDVCLIANTGATYFERRIGRASTRQSRRY